MGNEKPIISFPLNSEMRLVLDSAFLEPFDSFCQKGRNGYSSDGGSCFGTFADLFTSLDSHGF